jgi:hypothetical protein
LVGSTTSQLAAPTTHSAAATRKEDVHPKRDAIHGVNIAVRKAPNWLPVFMIPETVPDDPPAMSAVTDQKELWDK